MHIYPRNEKNCVKKWELLFRCLAVIIHQIMVLVKLDSVHLKMNVFSYINETVLILVILWTLFQIMLISIILSDLELNKEKLHSNNEWSFKIKMSLFSVNFILDVQFFYCFFFNIFYLPITFGSMSYFLSLILFNCNNFIPKLIIAKRFKKQQIWINNLFLLLAKVLKSNK